MLGLGTLAAAGGWKLEVKGPVHAKEQRRESTDDRVSDIRDELRSLQHRVALDEESDVAMKRGLEHAAESAVTQPSATASDRQVLPVAPPTIEHQTELFMTHFSNIDALRGTVPDTRLEARVRDVFKPGSVGDVGRLKDAKVDSVACGNQFCRIEIVFPDYGAARSGQTQVQIQLAAVANRMTMFTEPGSGRLHAYAATGSAELPDFPTEPTAGG